jgi:hypothetical protein
LSEIPKPDMQKIRIKEEVNINGKDKKQRSTKESLSKTILPTCANHVKKEIRFDGLPAKLQIQPLPDALKVEILEDVQAEKGIFKTPASLALNLRK